MVGKKRAAMAMSLLVLPQVVMSWGQQGHRIVGEIAQRHLSAKAKAGVASLIGNQSLAHVANWADEIKSDRAWDHAYPWHYISIEDNQTLATAPRNPQGDVFKAMKDSEATLRDPNASKDKKRDALRFLVHFVGDVHQPLHVGRAGDKGGNSIDVQWFGEPSNLHKVWDTEILRQEELSFTEYTDMIDTASPQDITKWQKDGYEVWIAESKGLRDKVYDLPPGKDNEPPNLKYNYFHTSKHIVRERLNKGGIRLAGLLNDIYK